MTIEINVIIISLIYNNNDHYHHLDQYYSIMSILEMNMNWGKPLTYKEHRIF